MSQFARMSLPLIQKLKELPPCARELHQYLLANHRAGDIQEIQLEPYAALCDCGLKYVRRCLRLLLDSGLVELVHRYSASEFKLVAHDDRTFDFATGKKFAPAENSSLPRENNRVQKTASKPDAAVTKNREEFRENRDTHPPDPVLPENEPGSDWISPKSPQNESVLGPDLMAEIGEFLQQPLNKNILAAIARYPEPRVRDALDAMREAIARGNPIKNLAGWFTSALHRAYRPNGRSPQLKPPALPAPQKPSVPDGFPVWFELALEAGVAIGSEQQSNGEIIIHSRESSDPFELARQAWPLQTLQELVNRSPVPSSTPPKRPGPAVNIPRADQVENERLRCNALARLQAKWASVLPGLKEQAIAEAEHWGFEVTATGIFEVAF